MRKMVLYLIITMSLVLTSGIHKNFQAQDRLEQALQALHARDLAIQIIQAHPFDEKRDANSPNPIYQSDAWQINTRVSEGNERLLIRELKTSDLSDLLQTYQTVREETKARGGHAYMEISMLFDGSVADLRGIGQQLLYSLGAFRLVQENQAEAEPNQAQVGTIDTESKVDSEYSNGIWYSGAAWIEDWGDTEQVNGEEFNVEIFLRPASNSSGLELSIFSPVLYN